MEMSQAVEASRAYISLHAEAHRSLSVVAAPCARLSNESSVGQVQGMAASFKAMTRKSQMNSSVELQ